MLSIKGMVQDTVRPDQITLEQHIKTAISQNPQFPDQISRGVKKTPLFFENSLHGMKFKCKLGIAIAK